MRSSTSEITHAAAGPVALGGLLALRLGTAAPALALPAIVFGITAITVPALYIATAVSGCAPPPRALAAALGRALAALGISLLGFLAPLAFLVATSSSRATWIGLSTAAVIGAVLIGLAALHRGLYDDAPPAAGRDALFATWAVVAVGIGARLFAELALEVS